jgi:hypothetical protein
MYHHTLRALGVFAAATCGAVLIAFAPAPALAIDGRTAVAICIDGTASGSQCVWSANEKGEVDICNKDGCIYCPSGKAECTAATGRSRPTRALPVGAKVTTPFGEIEVSKDPIQGSLLSARCPDSRRLCRNRCIGPTEKCNEDQ